LTGDNGDSDILNPAGMYIFANGIQYKVADLETFNKRYNEFTKYVSDTNTSIGNINASIADLSTNRVKTLEQWKKDMVFALGTDAKISIVGVGNSVKFTGGEYVTITPDVNSSIINVSITNSMVARATQTGRDAGNYRKLTTKGYVDSSLDVINSSISDISGRVSNTLADVVLLNPTSTAYNDVSVELQRKYEGHHNPNTWITAGVLNFKGDGNYVIADTDDNNVIKFTLDVNNQAIDGFSTTNASLSTTGVIKSYVDRKVANLTGAIRLIGEVDSSKATGTDTSKSMYHILRGVDASKGNMWIATAGFYYTDPSIADASTDRVEKGDQIIIYQNATTTVPAKYIVVERNLDGAVTAGTNILTADKVVIGTGEQKVKSSGYGIGKDASAGIAAGTNVSTLATEKAVHDYTEARIDDLKIVANSSTPDYVNVAASYDKITDTFSVSTGVKVVALANASVDAMGLVTAADVSSKLLAVEQTVAAAIATIKESAGLTDNLTVNWAADTAAAYGQNSSMTKVIDAINSSFKNASVHLNGRIDGLTHGNSDTAGKILVGISQDKGNVSSYHATIKVNDVSFAHTVGGDVTVTIDGTHIKVGGNTTQWKDMSVSTAIADLSNMIANVSGGFLRTVHGETPLAPDTNHKAVDEYVAVYASPTADNSTRLNSSVLVTKHPNVSSGTYSPAIDTGLATDGYVKDYVHSILEWETLS